MISDLIAYMLAGSAVTAALGTRLRPIQRDQSDTSPAARVNVISRTDDQTFTGPSGYVASRVQVDVYAATYASADGAASAIRARLNGFAGTQGATHFLGVFPDSESTGFEAGDAPADKLVSIRLDFMVHWRTSS